MLAIGAVAGGRRLATTALYALSLYFLLCLRLDHFREWSWDADMQRVYGAVAYYNHRYGVKQVVSNWMYTPSLNFYRLASGRETFDEFLGEVPGRSTPRVYVLNFAFDEERIVRERLRRKPDFFRSACVFL
jgi:hypothetical protein